MPTYVKYFSDFTRKHNFPCRCRKVYKACLSVFLLQSGFVLISKSNAYRNTVDTCSTGLHTHLCNACIQIYSDQNIGCIEHYYKLM